MPAIIDVRYTLGAILLGCFIAVACVACLHFSLLSLTNTASSTTQILGSCGIPGMHLLPDVPSR